MVGNTQHDHFFSIDEFWAKQPYISNSLRQYVTKDPRLAFPGWDWWHVTDIWGAGDFSDFG